MAKLFPMLFMAAQHSRGRSSVRPCSEQFGRLSTHLSLSFRYLSSLFSFYMIRAFVHRVDDAQGLFEYALARLQDEARERCLSYSRRVAVQIPIVVRYSYSWHAVVSTYHLNHDGAEELRLYTPYVIP
jgi:hypothetical protein